MSAVILASDDGDDGGCGVDDGDEANGLYIFGMIQMEDILYCALCDGRRMRRPSTRDWQCRGGFGVACDTPVSLSSLYGYK
jgi:ribosomal protein L37AE/L43A